MINEYQSATVFEQLAEQLRQASFRDAVVQQFAAFADEERSHGVACGAVVEALGAQARAPAPPQTSLPEHPDVSRREAALRNILSICYLSETVAVALIGVERLEMPEGDLRELLTGLWADEIGHANLGWRVLREELATNDDPDLPVRLTAYLRVALGALEAHELTHLPVGGPVPLRGSQVGLCDGRASRATFRASVDWVIIPALQRLGLAARHAWATRVMPPVAA